MVLVQYTVGSTGALMLATSDAMSISIIGASSERLVRRLSGRPYLVKRSTCLWRSTLPLSCSPSYSHLPRLAES